LRGWILDLYSESPGKMVVWVRLEDGGTRRLVDRWEHSIFVAADRREDLDDVFRDREVPRSRFVRRLERATDREESEVLEVAVEDAKRTLAIAKRIERSKSFGAYRLYNVDVPPEQMYLYEKDLFPLAFCEVDQAARGLRWRLLDDNRSCVYRLPPMRSAAIEVRIAKAGRLPKSTDSIESIAVGDGKDTTVIDSGTEGDKIIGLVDLVRRLDPDIILTKDGDSFTLPYLIARAQEGGVADKLTLDREGTVMGLPSKKGTSYFSYGKILFKPSAIKFRGRIHLDRASSFVCAESGMDGFYEMSRVCRLPLHTASRASIGKCLSSLQFYYATKEGLLIPWKPSLAEHFKSRVELLNGDRGGFVFEPKIGVHENVGELDFSSLFPAIMAKKNISPETVRCSCCPDSANRVPELDWNVCERRPKGVVPKAVEIIVEKRLKYKALEKGTKSEEDKARYASRKNALKWVGVACLPKESPVLVRRDGADKFVRIGDFIDGLVGDQVGVIECPPGVFVAGVDHDYKAKYCKVARLIKKPNDQKLLSVAMEDELKIVTTPDHLFFTLREGRLEVKTADELETGDVVPTRKKIPASRELDGNQAGQIDGVEKLINGDLGFVRVRRVGKLDDCPEYVYCFQLEEGEVPGFFAGEGLTFTHNCFGYLGFNNAKFGRIDAHMAVCAWDRRILMDAARVAERRGFRVMHGIVDSLWLKKEGAGEDEYRRLAREIREETGFDIVFEGLYKWIVFPPSKTSDALPVLNRYFGAYADGKLKVRGIEARRHDTPSFFSRCQAEILQVLAGARDAGEAVGMVDECVGIFLRHAGELLEGRVPVGELVYTRNLSKAPGEYVNRSLTSSVADRLVREGVELHAGESVEYVIEDQEAGRAVPLDLVDARTTYDAARYVELLAEACSTVLEPFRKDCSAEGLVREVEKYVTRAVAP